MLYVISITNENSVIGKILFGENEDESVKRVCSEFFNKKINPAGKINFTFIEEGKDSDKDILKIKEGDYYVLLTYSPKRRINNVKLFQRKLVFESGWLYNTPKMENEFVHECIIADIKSNIDGSQQLFYKKVFSECKCEECKIQLEEYQRRRREKLNATLNDDIKLVDMLRQHKLFKQKSEEK